MEDEDTKSPAFDDAVLLEMAGELRRLANVLMRNVRRRAVLPSLSELTAMRPLQAMLTQALSSRLSQLGDDVASPAGAVDERPEFEPPGYL